MTRTAPAPVEAEMQYLSLKQLHASPNNLRQDLGDLTELADSIEAHGLIEPLIARPNDDGFELIAGHRRAGAIQLLIDAKRIPAKRTWPTVVRTDVTNDTAQALMVVENLHRSGLSPIEELTGFLNLVNEHGWSTARIAKETAIPESTIKARLKLAPLPQHILAAVHTGRMTIADATRLTTLNAAAVANLTKNGKLPNEWDVKQSIRAQELDREKARIVKFLTGKGHYTMTDKRFKTICSDPDTADASNPAEVYVSVAQRDDTLVWSDTWVRTDKAELDKIVLDLKPGSIFTTSGTGYMTVYLQRALKVDEVAAAEAAIDAPTNDLERAYAAAEEQHAADLQAWTEQFRDAQRQYLANTKPAQLIATVLLQQLAQLQYHIVRDVQKWCEMLGLDPMDGETLMAWGRKTSGNCARLITATHLYDVPGFDTPRPVEAEIDEDDYDENGALIPEDQRVAKTAEVGEDTVTCACGLPETSGVDHGDESCVIIDDDASFEGGDGESVGTMTSADEITEGE